MIAYHGMSGCGKIEDSLELARGRHCFISYASPDPLPLVASVCSSFALDNGAYSAWSLSKEYDFAGFENFVEEWRLHPSFDFAIIPDVIGGSEEENLKLVEDWMGKDCSGSMIPVFHLHASLDYLRELIGIGRLALGAHNLHRTPGTPAWWERMEEIMEVLTDEDGRPRARLHGLKMLDPRIFERIPLHSADSTNAERNGLFEQRFGMYTPPTRGQRAAVIASMIDVKLGAAAWQRSRQEVLALS